LSKNDIQSGAGSKKILIILPDWTPEIRIRNNTASVQRTRPARQKFMFFIWKYDPPALRLVLSCVFQQYFLPVFSLLCYILVPSLQLLWRQGDGMKTSLCQSLFGCIYLSPFLVVGRPLPGTS